MRTRRVGDPNSCKCRIHESVCPHASVVARASRPCVREIHRAMGVLLMNAAHMGETPMPLEFMWVPVATQEEKRLKPPLRTLSFRVAEGGPIPQPSPPGWVARGKPWRPEGTRQAAALSPTRIHHHNRNRARNPNRFPIPRSDFRLPLRPFRTRLVGGCTVNPGKPPGTRRQQRTTHAGMHAATRKKRREGGAQKPRRQKNR